jgi:hypothetical protein
MEESRSQARDDSVGKNSQVRARVQCKLQVQVAVTRPVEVRKEDRVTWAVRQRGADATAVDTLARQCVTKMIQWY